MGHLTFLVQDEPNEEVKLPLGETSYCARLSGAIPHRQALRCACSVIKTPLAERMGTKAGPIARWLLRGRRTKHWMRTFHTLRSLHQLKRSSLRGISYKDVFQAGKSAGSIHSVEPAGDIARRFHDVASART